MSNDTNSVSIKDTGSRIFRPAKKKPEVLISRNEKIENEKQEIINDKILVENAFMVVGSIEALHQFSNLTEESATSKACANIILATIKMIEGIVKGRTRAAFPENKRYENYTKEEVDEIFHYLSVVAKGEVDKKYDKMIYAPGGINVWDFIDICKGEMSQEIDKNKYEAIKNAIDPTKVDSFLKEVRKEFDGLYKY